MNTTHFNCFSPINSFDLVLLSKLCCFERSSSRFGCHGGIVNDNYCSHGASGKRIGTFSVKKTNIKVVLNILFGNVTCFFLSESMRLGE